MPDPEIKERALNALNLNRGEGEYTPPALKHYPHIYLWDTAFIAWIRGHFGDIKGAYQELKTLFRTQNKETGFIPNITFAKGLREKDPERLTFLTREHSDYTQPPVLAMAIEESYKNLLAQGQDSAARKLVREFHPDLINHLEYFIKFRENGGGSHLIYNIHPHETGRDADPTFDAPAKKIRLPTEKNTHKAVRVLNGVLDYGSILLLNLKLKSLNWDPVEARRIFCVNDVMFNVLYADNLAIASNLAEVAGDPGQADALRKKAEKVEEEILTKMWHPKDQMFYALDGKKHIPVVSISNLFPVLLQNIDNVQLQRMLDVIEDPNWFGTKFPLPSVPVNSRYYDPGFEEPRIWRGGSWGNTNFLIATGLLRQGERLIDTFNGLAKRCIRAGIHIANQTGKLVSQGYFEFYNPETGMPLRTGTVRNFAWSVLAEPLVEIARRVGEKHLF